MPGLSTFSRTHSSRGPNLLTSIHRRFARVLRASTTPRDKATSSSLHRGIYNLQGNNCLFPIGMSSLRGSSRPSCTTPCLLSHLTGTISLRRSLQASRLHHLGTSRQARSLHREASTDLHRRAIPPPPSHHHHLTFNGTLYDRPVGPWPTPWSKGRRLR